MTGQKHRDPVQAHLDEYPYKRGNAEVNAALVTHTQEEHPEDYARVALGSAVGDLEDQHYIAHGVFSEAELRREAAADLLGGTHA